jgi:hypothetical protein
LGNVAVMAKKKEDRDSHSKENKDRHINPSLGLRFRGELVVRFRQLAKRNRRTLTAEMEIALEKHLQEAGLWPPTDTEEGE